MGHHLSILPSDPTILIPFGALAFVSFSIVRVIVNLVRGKKLYEPPIQHSTVDDPNRNTGALR
ncbi:MAG TPA: hypothetical protein VFA04_07155 [Bryobacteraceae bacterium]|jgi:hypothetical protein|nr:hypothetical protein [Bryobacteraceae bacterium]